MKSAKFGSWQARTRCWVPSLFGELQVRRLLSDLDAAGCWLGPANGNLYKCALAGPSRRPTCQSLTTYSKHANPDQTRRRGGDGRCGARVLSHRQRSVAHSDPVATTATVLKVVDRDTVDIVDDVRGRLGLRLLGIFPVK